MASFKDTSFGLRLNYSAGNFIMSAHNTMIYEPVVTSLVTLLTLTNNSVSASLRPVTSGSVLDVPDGVPRPPHGIAAITGPDIVAQAAPS